MKINACKVKLGCDPELFITEEGKVVGSEKVVGGGLGDYGDRVIPDGVQVELNPYSSYCRNLINTAISRCFRILNDNIKRSQKIDFSVAVEVGKKGFDSLSEKSKTFGCKPSYNVNTKSPSIMEEDPAVYRIRTAGGHIHLGTYGSVHTSLLQDVKRLVPVLDVVLGNTCVLIDRDPGNVERRKNYGRAGEYRLPPYGVEYRTLSNFWLRHPALSSLVFGLARHAVNIVKAGVDQELMSLVDYTEVVRAINENDFDLAKKNFDAIKGFLIGTVDTAENGSFNCPFPLDETTLPGFEILVKTGIDKVFQEDPVRVWCNHEYGEDGFHDFITKLIKLTPPNPTCKTK